MTNEIYLYGIIGDEAAGLDAKTVIAAIRAASGDLAVHINSGGGFVFEGLPIYEALASYDSGLVTVHIEGVAASMASVVAMAGGEIIMADTALMMIHQPWNSSIGNAAELRRDADQLDKIGKQLIGIYAKRTGLSPAKIAAMLDAETWLDASEALALGFVTSTSESLKIAAMADVSACGFHNLPEILKGKPMPLPATTAPMNATEISDVRNLVRAHGLPESVATDIFRAQLNMPAARAHILDVLATAGDNVHIGHADPARHASAETLDNPEFHARAVADVLYARMSGAAPEGAARELMDTSLIDLAREMLVRQGVRNAARMKVSDVLDAASWGNARGSASRRSPWLASAPQARVTHTTGDFPGLLLDASQRFLNATFQTAETVLKQVARERTANDFRTMAGVQLSGFGTLPTVREGGEITSGTFTERKESYAIATFGKMFGISRQAIVNDDLGAFADMFRVMGRAAAETEATVLVGLLNANPNMSDGNALFSVAHGNYIATGGAAPAVTQLDLMRQNLRTQKDLDGVTLLNIPAKYMVVPTAFETSAQVLCGAALWTATAQNAANPFAGTLIPLTEPRLTDAAAYYLFGDPLLAPVLEYASLDGVTGPQVEMKEGWSTLGQEFRVYHHFGAGITGFNGAVKNKGS